MLSLGLGLPGSGGNMNRSVRREAVEILTDRGQKKRWSINLGEMDKRLLVAAQDESLLGQVDVDAVVVLGRCDLDFGDREVCEAVATHTGAHDRYRAFLGISHERFPWFLRM